MGLHCMSTENVAVVCFFFHLSSAMEIGIGPLFVVRTYCPVLPVLSDAAMPLRNVQEETGYLILSFRVFYSR